MCNYYYYYYYYINTGVCGKLRLWETTYFWQNCDTLYCSELSDHIMLFHVFDTRIKLTDVSFQEAITIVFVFASLTFENIIDGRFHISLDELLLRGHRGTRSGSQSALLFLPFLNRRNVVWKIIVISIGNIRHHTKHPSQTLEVKHCDKFVLSDLEGASADYRTGCHF